MSQSKPRVQVKIGQIKLTEHEKEVLALGLDSEFFKIIQQKITPQRLVQLALTSIAGTNTEEGVEFFRGRYAEATWLAGFIKDATSKIDVDDGDPDDDGLK